LRKYGGDVSMPETNKLLTHLRNFPLDYEQLPRQGVWACAGQVTCCQHFASLQKWA